MMRQERSVETKQLEDVKGGLRRGNRRGDQLTDGEMRGGGKEVNRENVK